jgi:hypothetical protein
VPGASAHCSAAEGSTANGLGWVALWIVTDTDFRYCIVQWLGGGSNADVTRRNCDKIEVWRGGRRKKEKKTNPISVQFLAAAACVVWQRTWTSTCSLGRARDKGGIELGGFAIQLQFAWVQRQVRSREDPPICCVSQEEWERRGKAGSEKRCEEHE